MKKKKIDSRYIVEDWDIHSLRKILKEAYKHPDFKWVDECFDKIEKEVENDNEEDLEFTQKQYDMLDLFGDHCKLKVLDEKEGFGSYSIQGGYWNEYRKLPVCFITNDFLKNFVSSYPYHLQDCKNAFKSFIAHEMSHGWQNKILDEENDIGVFNVVPPTDDDLPENATPEEERENLKKYVLHYHEFDAHARSVAQSLLNSGFNEYDALKKLQTPDGINEIISKLKKREPKAVSILKFFLSLRDDYNIWFKFLRKIYNYYYLDDLNEN